MTMLDIIYKAYLAAKDIAYAMLMDVVQLFCLGRISWLRPYLVAMIMKHSAKDSILITLSCVLCDVMEPSVYDTDRLYETSVKVAQLLNKLYSPTFIKCWTRDTFTRRYRSYRSTFNYNAKDKIQALKLALDADITFNDMSILSLKKVISKDIESTDKLKLIADTIYSSKTKDYIFTELDFWAKTMEKICNGLEEQHNQAQ